MRLKSSLSRKEYLAAMKRRMGSFTDIGAERFTGIFVGSFFSVTHHAGYEYNRRITNEKNSALGFVKQTAEGSEIRFIRLKGLTTPRALFTQLLVYFLAIFLLFIVEGFVDTQTLFISVVFSLGMTVFVALFTAVCDSLTQKGEEGAKILLAFLIEPTDPFSYLHHG